MCAARAKSNLSVKTRNARRQQIRRKNYTAEELDAIRKKEAVKAAEKRAAETAEQRDSRRRRDLRRIQEKRNHQKAKERYLRTKNILNEVKEPKRKNKALYKEEDKQIENAERQLALGQIVVKALTKKLHQKELQTTEDTTE